jgi:ankyrin repeat protein
MKFEAPNDHPIFAACLNGDIAAVRQYLAEGVHFYANGVISAAIRGGHPSVFQAFLDSGLDVNQPFSPTVGVTPIFRTIEKKQMAILNLLLENGASVGYDPTGSSTPLHTAAAIWPEAIPILLEAGAEVDARNSVGRTPLIAAAIGNQIQSLEQLLEAGGNLEDRDARGSSALISASKAGSFEAVEWLLDHGADLLAEDARGKTAEDWARENGHPKIAELLQSRMGT